MAFAKGINRAVKGAFRRWLGITTSSMAIATPAPVEKRERLFSPAAISDLSTFFAAGREVGDTFRAPVRPKWVDEWLATARSGANGGQVRLAMDSVPFEDIQDYALLSSPWSEGLGFLGYGYLSELQQRPEYRRISEIWAAECTRKWIKLKGDDPKRIAAVEKLMKDFGAREKFREAIEVDGAQGRSHVFMDFGDDVFDLQDPLEYTPETVPVGALKNLKVVEPFWCYPLQFGTTNPLANDYYRPSQWQVMSSTVHNSRLLTFVGRELPDILKPVYMFGGLSLSQMAKPYIDNFIKNRTSVANLLYSFSTMVLSTNMGAMLDADGAQAMIRRMQAYAYGRDNGGLMMVDKETEDLKNVSAPISGVDKLLAQAQEFISSVVGIPLVVLLGVTPSGLNASSEGELTAFHDHIKGYQEKTLQAPLTALLRVLQLHLDGRIDETLTFEFVNLSEPTELEKSTMRQNNMTTATGYINAGVLSPEDERERLMGEEGGLWYGMKLKEPPAPQDYNDDGPDDDGGRANDAGETQHWITVHPDGPDSKGTPMLITSGGKVVGGAGGKLDGHILEHVQSMSGARQRGNQPERPAGHAEPPVAKPEHHKRDDETHQEHADRLSERANASGIVKHHEQAADAHRMAREEARAGGDYIEANRHMNSANRHEDKAQEIVHGADFRSHFARQASATADHLSATIKPDSIENLQRLAEAHRDAHAAHSKARQHLLDQGVSAYGGDPLMSEHADGMNHHRDLWNKAVKKRESIERALIKKAKERAAKAKAEALGQGGRFEELNGRHVDKTHAELDKHFRERWGMGIHDAKTGHWNVRSHTDVDLDKGNEAAKTQKQILGHVEAALEHLEAQGFDIKRALQEANVHYSPAGVGKAIGHAFPAAGKSFFSISHGKHSLAYHQDQHDTDQRKIAKGLPTWSATASSPAAFAPQAVIIHELVHAIAQHAGGKRDNGTERKLAEALQKSVPGNKRDFILKNISEYALKNLSETEAELGAKVTAPGYKRGSLPKELEDHVDAMFMHKGREG